MGTTHLGGGGDTPRAALRLSFSRSGTLGCDTRRRRPEALEERCSGCGSAAVATLNWMDFLRGLLSGWQVCSILDWEGVSGRSSSREGRGDGLGDGFGEAVDMIGGCRGEVESKLGGSDKKLQSR